MLLAIPAGYWLAWLCRDELLQGRKWFVIIMILSVIAGVVMLFIGDYTIALTMLFVLITTFISYRKSFDKKWTKRKI